MRYRAGRYRDLGEPPRQRYRWMRNIPATPWRWRWELGIPVGLDVLAQTTHPVVAGAVALVAAAPFARRGLRNWLTLRLWAVLLQHRLRVGMSECDLTSWSGRLPTILRTRVADRGVAITVWLPPGLNANDFRVAAPNLAVACWAAGVEITRHPRFAQLVVVLVRSREDED